MKVIIDISEESYKYICNNSTEESNMRISDIIRKRESISSELMKSIVNSTVVSDDADALEIAIKALEKQKAISELQPPTDDWDSYADRLYDLAYLSGYNDGLIAKRGN